MPLPKPNLDNRTFQDIVDEAKRRITQLSPSWTDHNVSDPGVTLIELFAWMTEMLLYRMNQVPERNLIGFLELLGVQLQPPEPALAELTFTLTAPLRPGGQPLSIPASTEVTTRQRRIAMAAPLNGAGPASPERGAEPLIFSTDRDLELRPPAPGVPPIVLVTPKDEIKLTTSGGEPFQVFSKEVAEGESLWVGTLTDLSGHLLTLEVNCDHIEGSGINPDHPPLVWEAACKGGLWQQATRERDSTRGFNQSGVIVLHLPQQMERGPWLADESYRNYYWLRCRLINGGPENRYKQPPRVQGLRLATLGGTVGATQAVTTYGDVIGVSDGTPGQRFYLSGRPVLPLSAGEALQVEGEDGTWTDWQQAPTGHFGDSEGKRHFRLDRASGEISFGPQIREPDGRARQYGDIPTRGRRIRMSRYRVGGGAAGNVPAGSLTELTRSLSYVAEVTNRTPALGGRDAEDIERAKLRARQLLRTGERAVTTGDYEHLATVYLNNEVPPGVARVRCLPPVSANGPQAPIRLLLVPNRNYGDRGPITPDVLTLPEGMAAKVEDYLNAHSVLTTSVKAQAPEYVQVAVFARMKARTRDQSDAVRHEAEVRLYRFLHPTTGGPAGDRAGWPFGRSLYLTDVLALLQTIPGLDYIEWLTLQPAGGERSHGPIVLGADQLILSGQHQIEMIE